MSRKRTNLKLYAICLLLLLFAAPASADPDAMLDRSRTQFEDLIEYEIYYINARFNEIRNDLFLIPDITIIADRTSGSASAQDFINGINLLDDTTDVNVVLIQTHGGTVPDTSYLIFKDNSGLSSTGVNNWMDERDGGFIFAGACYSAKYTGLGNAFINNGFDTYFGFKDVVRTLPTSRFCSAFFDAATFTDVTVSEAAIYARNQVKKEFGDATDVANYRFIGNSNLCLRT
ncbi:MAG: hypothetical protein LHW64_11780 [Candidatus Cloacimonetes bacterium]|uniref:Gingipain domain-containing protein n=1 Tax=Methanosarcina mazei TaxID=2209 RepID=A0A0F8I715_METMZ|nr:hypothetical protein [Methanosarcina mazei]KKG59318.1 hypothetical protein DU67_08870 [Methanosarcina mazei]MCB5288462.1 hypothetical protein [Candidatus Cloacimonadota bacterium]MDO5839518.1 hypothetical protein [Methanosarcina mazei]QIB92301.1 hypothetical protein FQU78_15780 [Methanosarcina mazei]